MAKLPTSEDLGSPPSARSGRHIATYNPRPNTAVVGQGFAQLGHGISQLGAALAEHEQRKDAFATELRFQEFDFAQQRAFEDAKTNMQPGQAGGFADSWIGQYEQNATSFLSTIPSHLQDKYRLKLFEAERNHYRNAATFAHAEQMRSAGNAIEDQINNRYFPRAYSGENVDKISRDYRSILDENPYLSPIDRDEMFRKGMSTIEKAHVRGRLERGDISTKVEEDVRSLTEKLGAEILSSSEAAISTLLETGKTNPLEGVANISKDAGHTKSYGNFGLNSGGSIQKFVDEYGSKFGFTENPGSKAFDDQWKIAAATAPDKLHAAEMEWYTKNITSGIVNKLTKVGVSREVANDPRVRAYFADRSVQQGSGSIADMDKHRKRISEAFNNSGGDVERFLTNITEADRVSLKHDFPTALRTGVYSERGHDHRLDGRLRMSLDLSVPSQNNVVEFKKSPVESKYKYLNVSERFTLLNEIHRFRAKEIARVRAEVNKFDDAAAKGYAVPADQMRALTSKVASIDDPTLAAELRTAQETLLWQDSARHLRPDELDLFIRQEDERLKQGGATPFDLKRLDMANKLLTTMRQELKRDSLAWADRTGLVKIEPLDFSTPENAQASLGKRIEQVRLVAQRYGQIPQFLRPDERQSLVTMISQGGDETLSVAATIASAAGENAPAIMGEVFKDSPTAAAMIGGLVAETGAIMSAARDAADAMVLERQKDFQRLTGEPSEIRRRAVDVLGSALSGMPKTESAIIAAANLVYETRARKSGLSEFDSSVWQQGLREVLGERVIGDKTYGGIVDADPSMWSTRNIVIPPDVSQDNWRQIIDGLTPEDLAAADIGLPAGENGKPIPLSRAKGATLVQIGSGRYALSLGDPDTPGQERWIVRGDAPSQLFELDFAKLKPILSKRYDDLYLGAASQ